MQNCFQITSVAPDPTLVYQRLEDFLGVNFLQQRHCLVSVNLQPPLDVPLNVLSLGHLAPSQADQANNQQGLQLLLDGLQQKLPALVDWNNQPFDHLAP
jgi:hypothetical protein